MSSLINGRRIFAAIILAVTIITIRESYFDAPKLAQSNFSSPERVLADKFLGADAATTGFRSDSKVLSRVYVNNDADRQKAAQVGAIVEDYQKFVVVAKSPATEAKNYGLEEQEIETTINLAGARFDPVKNAPDGSLRLGSGATAEEGYYVLQFGGVVTDEWLKSLTTAGVEILQYVPHQAYFVYADAEAIARVANHSRVRWIGRYESEAKLSPVLKSQLTGVRKGGTLARGFSPIQPTKKGFAMFEIGVFARADLDEFVADLSASYAKGYIRASRLQHNFFNVVRAELRLADIEAVAALPDVVGIDPILPTKNEDERSAQVLAGNYLNSTTILGPGYNPANQFGVDGTNVTVSVVDDGVGIPGDGDFYISTLNSMNGPLRGAQSGALGHGHLNATIIAGSTPYGPLDSLFYNYGMGVAPRANIVSIPRNRNGYTGTDEEVYNDSVLTPGPNGAGAYISNNSWGNGTNGNAYSNTVEGRFDGYARDSSFDIGINPVTLVFSAGNDGANGLTRPKVAKNVISVGNSESLRTDLGGTEANNIDDVASDSSRGPAADGRIKPDVVAPGTAITGGRSGTDSLRGNLGTAHRWSSGTSHSAAHITGMAALFAHWWKLNNFNLDPSPALIKAAIINSAVDMSGGNASQPIPNGTEGWGRPNLKNMINTGVGMKHHNDDLVGLSAPGQGFFINGSVADGTKPVRVTLVWTDPPGVADPALINNLDLKVTVDGTVYRGNVFSNGVSVPGGTADNRNNVENVFLPAGTPAGRGLQIEVTATALNGDGILNNGDATDQAFSIVVYNYSPQAAPAFYNVMGRVVSQNNRGISMARVRFTNSQGITREAISNHLGYYSFISLAGNQNYTINVVSKRYTFTQRVEPINSNISSLDITSSGGTP